MTRAAPRDPRCLAGARPTPHRSTLRWSSSSGRLSWLVPAGISAETAHAYCSRSRCSRSGAEFMTLPSAERDDRRSVTPGEEEKNGRQPVDGSGDAARYSHLHISPCCPGACLPFPGKRRAGSKKSREGISPAQHRSNWWPGCLIAHDRKASLARVLSADAWSAEILVPSNGHDRGSSRWRWRRSAERVDQECRRPMTRGRVCRVGRRCSGYCLACPQRTIERRDIREVDEAVWFTSGGRMTTAARTFPYGLTDTAGGSDGTR